MRVRLQDLVYGLHRDGTPAINGHNDVDWPGTPVDGRQPPSRRDVDRGLARNRRRLWRRIVGWVAKGDRVRGGNRTLRLPEWVERIAIETRASRPYDPKKFYIGR
jgi:hypothetical protein